MGDTLGLIYPHGDFVQPNLPPPDFNKDVLFEDLFVLWVRTAFKAKKNKDQPTGEMLI